MMSRTLVLTLSLSVLTSPALAAAPKDDPIFPVHQFIDGMNSGNTRSAFAAYASGDVTIIDEFAL